MLIFWACNEVSETIAKSYQKEVFHLFFQSLCTHQSSYSFAKQDRPRFAQPHSFACGEERASPQVTLASWILEWKSSAKPSLGIIDRYVAIKLDNTTNFVEEDITPIALKTENDIFFSDMDPRELTLLKRWTKKETLSLADFLKSGWAPPLILSQNKEGLFLLSSPDFTPRKMQASLREAHNSQTLFSEVFRILGYDGVILDRKQKLFLVGSSSELLRSKDIQALALANTEDKIHLSGQRKTGAALLSLREAQGAFAMLEIVLEDKDTSEIKIGTKLLIQKADITVTVVLALLAGLSAIFFPAVNSITLTEEYASLKNLGLELLSFEQGWGGSSRAFMQTKSRYI